MKVCHHCGQEVKLNAELQRTDGCAHCHSDLKVCRNCMFFDPGKNNQCSEPAAEWCSDKEKANFCEFFRFSEVAGYGRPGFSGPVSTEKDRARDAFDALFKKR